MVIAAQAAGWSPVGVDVALRWLVIGQARLAEAGVAATLVCANAQQLPFRPGVFDAIVANDLIEHVRLPEAVAREACRVSAPGSMTVFTTNNRYAPLVEPQLRVWGVGYLPRRWQPAYVRWRRPDVHPYSVHLPSARELTRLCRGAGFDHACTEPAPLIAPHMGGPALQRLLTRYNQVRRWPLIGWGLTMVGPRLLTTATRSA